MVNLVKQKLEDEIMEVLQLEDKKQLPRSKIQYHELLYFHGKDKIWLENI